MRLDRSLMVVVAMLIAAVLAVFGLQPDRVFFGDGHVGWVSSHTLAIIANATPEHLFLGFTCDFSDSRGFSYFDRYPVLFSGVMNTLLQPFRDSVEAYVGWARFYMNWIYVFSLLMGYKIAMLLTRDRYVSLLATMFTFSGVFFVFYKDMVHFDQPAVLGMLLAFYGIARYEMDGNARWVWLSLVAVLLGRGYASNFLLLLWNVLWVARLLVARNFRVGVYFRSVPFKVFVACGLLASGALAYNVISEARIKEISWDETSIVKSAVYRLNLSDEEKGEGRTDIPRFLTDQAERTVGGFVPYALYPYQGRNKPDSNHVLIAGYLLILSVLGALSLFQTDLRARARGRYGLLALGLFCGFFWLFPMRNLAAFHNYTHIYNAIFYLLVFSGVFYCLRGKRASSLLSIVGLVVLVASLWELRETRADYNTVDNDLAADVDRIRGYLDDREPAPLYFPQGYRHLVDGSPYAACFYFSGYRIDDEESEGALVVTREKLPRPELVDGLERLHVYPGR
ncbi:hypothetical protein ACFL1S_03535 [Pseudomonadota bacterium]